MLTTYIVEGRELVKKLKGMERCKILPKGTIEVPTGPVSTKNILIAPAFFTHKLTWQVHSRHMHYAVNTKQSKYGCLCFCFTTTIIKIMDDYSTVVFIQSFVQFACKVGYLKKLILDEVSQLLSGCDLVKISSPDFKGHFYWRLKVEHEAFLVASHHMVKER